MDRSEPSFLVQALDNRGENLIQVAPWIGGRSARESTMRLREIVNRTGLDAAELPIDGGRARLRQRGDWFNLEVDLEARDSGGRVVTVLCHAGKPDKHDDAWPGRMAGALRAFLRAHALPEPTGLDRIYAEAGRLLGSHAAVRALHGFRAELMTAPFPEDPRRRRLLVFVDEASHGGLRGSHEGKLLLRDQAACVIPLPLDAKLLDDFDVLDHLDRKGRVEPGAVLVLHPHHEDRYVPLETLSEEVALSKIRITSDLCRRLGATLVQVEEASVDSASGRSQWSASGSSRVASGSADWLSSELAKVVRAVQVRDEFAGGPPDPEAAEALLRRHRLADDEELRNLIAVRTGDNPLQRRAIQVLTSEEIGSASQLAAKVRAALPRVGVDVRHAADELRSYSFKLTIEFTPRG